MFNGINGLREFGDFRLDVAKKTLWHGNRPVQMPLKELEILCMLVENRGELVTKDEILENVWEDSFVEESNLSRHIYLLRKTLKRLGSRANLIENVPRRGYRFAGEVRDVAKGDLVVEKHKQTRTTIEIRDLPEPLTLARGVNPTNRSFVSTTGLTAIILAAFLGSGTFFGYQYFPSNSSATRIKSIAVLPFKTFDTGSENGHQGMGLADVLITRLSNIKEIKVRPTSAVFALESSDSIHAGEKLKVEAVLEGTIYRTPDKVRVTARLIRVSDSSSIWTGEFEKSHRDELRLQDEIALRVIDALALNLTGNEKAAVSKSYTENTDAFQLYSKGRYEWNKRSWEGMNEAQRLFRNAIEKDPKFPLAYVGLADAIGTSTETEAFSAVKKALELDPYLAEAHATMGFLQMFHEWKWAEAETSLKKSIELNPGYATAHHWYATLHGIKGRNTEAKAELRRALEINPLSYNFLADLGQLHYFAREYREAKEHCEKALEIYPDFQFAHEYLADIYLQTGEYDKGVEEEIKSNRINLSFSNESAERKENLEVNFDQQRKIYQEGGIKKYLKTKISDRPTDAFDFYSNAMSLAFLGEKEAALSNLEMALERRSFMLAFVKAEPVFASLREEARFKEILLKMNL